MAESHEIVIREEPNGVWLTFEPPLDKLGKYVICRDARLSELSEAYERCRDNPFYWGLIVYDEASITQAKGTVLRKAQIAREILCAAGFGASVSDENLDKERGTNDSTVV